jgi:hypothetical protein
VFFLLGVEGIVQRALAGSKHGCEEVTRVATFARGAQR